MKRYVFGAILSSLIIIYNATAQNLLTETGQTITGLDAYSRNSQDAFSFSRNPAVLAGLTHCMAGMYAERRFMLHEADLYTISMASPTKLGHVGAAFSYAGFNLFHEYALALAYGRKLGNKLQAGMRFKYQGFSVPGYGRGGSLAAEIGFLLNPAPAWTIGLSASNLASLTFQKQIKEKPAALFTWGIGFDASEQVHIMTEIRKVKDRSLTVTGGVQYTFQKQFFVRAGFQTDSGAGFAGVGFVKRGYRLDVAGSYNPWLGFSPAITFQLTGKSSVHV